MTPTVKNLVSFRPDLTDMEHIALVRAYLASRYSHDRTVTDAAVLRYALDMCARTVYHIIQEQANAAKTAT